MKMWELANIVYPMVSPKTTVGQYTICRKYDYLFLQGIADYDFRDIGKDDVVLDLGASVGGFTIHAAKRCRHVYAVEPLFTNYLHDNILLNDVKNATIIPIAIGDSTRNGVLEFNRMKRYVDFWKFDALMKYFIPAGDVTFLKCDIEGAEKYVPFDQFDNIEAELHDFEKQEFRQYHKRNGKEVELRR